MNYIQQEGMPDIQTPTSSFLKSFSGVQICDSNSHVLDVVSPTNTSLRRN